MSNRYFNVTTSRTASPDISKRGHRVAYFAGPIFDVEDKFFNQLKAGAPTSQRRKGMRVPTGFGRSWPGVEDGLLLVAGFVLVQSDEILELGPTTEEIDFGAYTQTPIEEIALRAGPAFPELWAADTFQV